MNTYPNLPPEACESTARGHRAEFPFIDDAYTLELETQLEEGLLDVPDITIRFFEDPEGPYIETIENAYGYPIPRRKNYISIPSKPKDFYKVRNVVIDYGPDGSVTVEVFVSWVDIFSLEL